MYAAVSDINYIAESVASWEKESDSVGNCGPPVWLLRNFDSNVKNARNNKCPFPCLYLLL